MTEPEAIGAVLTGFFPGQGVVSVSPHGSGHIHRTYRVAMDSGTFLLQQFNHAVFVRPGEVASNIAHIHGHLSGKSFGQKIITPVHTAQGEVFFVSDSGLYWRVFEFIDGAFSLERAETLQQAFQAGKAFGAFAAALQELPPDLLYESIPGFHDSLARWKYFSEVVLADPAGRVTEAEAEIELLYRHQEVFHAVHALELPVRVVHNDAKIGNVLFAKDSGAVLAVTDWDTIMPGSILADFGDLTRSITNPVEEDDPREEMACVQMPLFEALCQGFLSQTASMLSPAEREHLVLGAQWIILEQALRFLSDYLAGDVYYPVEYAGHNLVRARNQLHLFCSVLQQEVGMQTIAKNIFGFKSPLI